MRVDHRSLKPQKVESQMRNGGLVPTAQTRTKHPLGTVHAQPWVEQDRPQTAQQSCRTAPGDRHGRNPLRRAPGSRGFTHQGSSQGSEPQSAPRPLLLPPGSEERRATYRGRDGTASASSKAAPRRTSGFGADREPGGGPTPEAAERPGMLLLRTHMSGPWHLMSNVQGC